MPSLLVTNTMGFVLELEQSSAEEEGSALMLGSWRPGGIAFFTEPDDVVMGQRGKRWIGTARDIGRLNCNVSFTTFATPIRGQVYERLYL